jgi:hypothetical protein
MVFLTAIAWAALVCTTVYLGFAIYIINETPENQLDYKNVRQVFVICIPLIVVSVLWLIYG